MGAVWFRFRSELRARWRAWTVLALLIGVASGVVIAAVAGARRTDSAYERFLHEQRAFDVVAFPVCEGFDNAETPPKCADVSALARLAGVSASAPVSSISGADIRTADGRSLDREADGNFVEVALLGSTDGGFGRTLNRMHVIDGRLPRADALHEVALSAPLAARAGIEVGDTLRARFDRYPNGHVTYTLRVVGIELSPYEVAPPSGAYILAVHVSPEFVRRAPARGLRVETGLALRLHGGDRGVGAVRRAVEARRINAFVAFRQADQAAGIERAIRPDTVGLTLLAVFGSLALVAVFGTALARHAWAESSDSATLWSLGVRRRQLVAMTIIRAAFIGLVAMAMAVVVAFFLSVLTPIGLARDLEPSPGLHADAVTLGVGAVLTVVLTLALIAVPAWLIARSVGSGARRRSLVRPSRVAATVSRAGGSIPAIVGVRMALERDRGRESVPVRTGVLGVVVGVVVLCAAVGFSASLDHLLESPRLIGYTWDATVFVGEEDSLDVDADAVAAEIEMISGIAATTPGAFVFGSFFTDRPLLLGSHRRAVDLLVIGPGRVHPAVIDGRAPIGADEILLGPETLQEVGLEVGDTLTAFGQVGPDIRVEGEKSIVLNEPDVGKGTSARFRIVGSGVPPFGAGAGGADPRTESRLGRGAVMTVAGLQRLNPVARPNALYVRFNDRADRASAFAALRREERAGSIGEVSSVNVSTEETLDVEQIDEFPLVLAGLVAFVAACVLAHLLVTSTRARRRDFAVLRALGFRRRQVRGVITWQAATIVAIALVVGMPLGVVLGRWGWQLYAGTISVVPEAAVSGLALVVTAIGAIAVAKVVATLPARTATHTRPAVVLRSE